MDDYRSILKRVGLVLIVFGILDIGLMVWCIYNQTRYSSSFNIFAVVAGVFLRRGSLRAARIVAWNSALLLTAFVGLVVAMAPIAGPVDLWVTAFRLYPITVLGTAVASTALIALVAWVYKKLRSAPVVRARLAAGLKSSPPRLAFVFGGIFVLAGAGLVIFTLTTGAGGRALEMAREQYGDGYRYHVTGMHWFNGQLTADVVAFNADEIKSVHVQLPR
jgi:hypothetical protein